MLKRPNDKEYIRPLCCFSLSRVSTQKHVSDSETKHALNLKSNPKPPALPPQTDKICKMVLRPLLYYGYPST